MLPFDEWSGWGSAIFSFSCNKQNNNATHNGCPACKPGPHKGFCFGLVDLNWSSIQHLFFGFECTFFCYQHQDADQDQGEASISHFLKVKSKKQKAGNVPAQSGMVSNNDEPGLKEE